MAFIKIDKDNIILFPDSDFKNKMQNANQHIKDQMALHREFTQLADHWKDIMAQTRSYNEAFQTYTLSHIKKENYGYSCRIYAPDGLIIDDLEKLRLAIESGLKCIFIFKLSDFKEMAIAQFIKNVNCNDIPFTPYKVKPWECYAGVDPSGKPLVFNMIKDTNIFLSGNNGRGKSKCNDHILTSFICNCPKNDIWIFLIQLDKEDLIIYEDAEQVMGFADTLEKTDMMLEYITQEMKRRTEIMRPLKKKGLANNVYEYNRHNPKNKFPMILIDIDEFSSLVHELSDSNDIKKLKDSIVTKLIKIAQVGRAMAIFYVISIQRPTVDRVHPFIKSQSNVKIVFGVSNQKSSEVCIDNDMAVGLPPRRAITCVNGDYSVLFTTKLPDTEVLRFIKPYLKPGHRNIFNIIESKSQENTNVQHEEVKQGKIPKQHIEQDFSKVTPDKELILQENIKMIPGWVPYEPIEGGRIKK